MSLKEMKCVPCEKGTKPMEKEEAKEFLSNLSGGWSLVDDKKIRKEYDFEDFTSALDFVNQIGRVAEDENHHPDIVLKYGKTEVEISTHYIGGLSKNDFILADKIDALADGS